MIATIRSEWLKLRTTAVPWVLGAIALVITGLLILVYFVSHDSSGGGNGPGANSFGFPNYPHTTQQLRNLLGSGFEGYLFALLLGALMVTAEFRHKTVTTSFLVTPRRPQFVAGKLITAAILGVVLAVILMVATLIGGGVTLVAQGGSFSDLARQIPAVAPGMILVFALFGILGVGIGSLLDQPGGGHHREPGLVRHPGGHPGQPGPRRRQVGAYRRGHGGRQPDPGQGSDFGLFNWWQGALLMLAYGLIFAVIGSVILTRRDIT